MVLSRDLKILAVGLVEQIYLIQQNSLIPNRLPEIILFVIFSPYIFNLHLVEIYFAATASHKETSVAIVELKLLSPIVFSGN